MRATAPIIDRLLRFFDRGYLNPYVPTQRIKEAMEPLFTALSQLAPLKENSEAKTIWVMIPRGSISDYDSFEDMKEYGEVDTYEEYVQRWKEDYPDEYCWYDLTVYESFNKDGTLRYRGVIIGNRFIISASMEDKPGEYSFSEDAAVELCEMMTEAAGESIRKLREGVYNEEVSKYLPYQFRTGVVKRSVVWDRNPEYREQTLDGLSEKKYNRFKQLIENGANDEPGIGRLERMTANDFFRACAIGYKACGFEGADKSPVDQYFMHADGRDEGLTGRGYGLNAGPGIDPDSPDAWDQWYFHRKHTGGHPWEVCRGGNSTHVDIMVHHDQIDIDWKLATGKISQEEADRHPRGYYFSVAGKHRPVEAISFYVALTDAGLPVFLFDADAILARFEGTDYIGIVPHHVIPKYCESMFPARFGRVIDFMHVYEEELELYGESIEWLPEEQAQLKDL